MRRNCCWDRTVFVSLHNKNGMKFQSCEWKCLTTRDVTNKKFDSSGDGGNKSTKPRGVAAQQEHAGGRPCNDACDPHANAQESS